MEKFSDILEQYRKEVSRIRNIFVTYKDNPPCSKDQPPIGVSPCVRIRVLCLRPHQVPCVCVSSQPARLRGAALCTTA